MRTSVPDFLSALRASSPPRERALVRALVAETVREEEGRTGRLGLGLWAAGAVLGSMTAGADPTLGPLLGASLFAAGVGAIVRERWFRRALVRTCRTGDLVDARLIARSAPCRVCGEARLFAHEHRRLGGVELVIELPDGARARIVAPGDVDSVSLAQVPVVCASDSVALVAFGPDGRPLPGRRMRSELPAARARST